MCVSSTANCNSLLRSPHCLGELLRAQQSRLSGATLYVLASRSGGAYNCVVTIKTANRGKATYVGTSITASDGRGATDEGNFLYYAGPIRIDAPGMCIRWGGAGSNRSWWTSGWSYCG
jgi:hypothetical protein